MGNQVGFWDQPDYADPNRVIRLIYWNNIIGNFQKNIGNLNNSSYNEMSKKLFGVGLPDLSTQSRKDIYDIVMQLNAQIYNTQNIEDTNAKNKLQSYAWKLKKLVELDPSVIPLNWATETDSDAILLSLYKPSNQLFN
jgi:hypothetical protein